MKELKETQSNKVKNASIDRGIIIVNTGDGKGKSSSAFGTVFRAVGQGLNVAVIQFIKGSWTTGEMNIFKKFESITHIVSGAGFTWDTQDKEKDILAALKGWEVAKEICRDKDNKFQLLVLDEINLALAYKFLDIKEVVEVLANKPDSLNIILTGRNAPSEVIEIADTVTEMVMIKHAFESGIKAQKGIEF
ncbi:cob(I)yrinic acid a,c-diamide adenosyltransferase [Thiospirochaeta perfilievii]|uniref:corrinoid adenosyltransferase n=2 Tax=Thiospirochaeta perfilievii TaxID=252967 RepID=A0A5C1QE54_9SPIO|nr:cob(I)yrinic acid a,c-diamide adenosyltransferase [Thiospirochaeta perfilievii]